MDDIGVGFVFGTLLVFVVNVVVPTTELDASEIERATIVCEGNGGLKSARPDGYLSDGGRIYCVNGAEFSLKAND